METETKINFLWIVIAVILAGLVMPIWAIVLTPVGLVGMGLFIIIMITLIGTDKK